MSMVEAAKRACEALQPKPGETALQFAERLYLAQMVAYDEHSCGMLGDYTPFSLLREHQAGWLTMAEARLANQATAETATAA